MAHMTQAQQKKVAFTEDELDKIVSYIPHEEAVTYQDDKNVKHQGTEIYQRLGVIAEIFQYNFNIEEMMEHYDNEIPINIVVELILRRIITHLLSVAKSTLKWKNMLFRIS